MCSFTTMHILFTPAIGYTRQLLLKAHGCFPTPCYIYSGFRSQFPDIHMEILFWPPRPLIHLSLCSPNQENSVAVCKAQITCSHANETLYANIIQPQTVSKMLILKSSLKSINFIKWGMVRWGMASCGNKLPFNKHSRSGRTSGSM